MSERKFLGIYGTGIAAQMTFEALQRMDVNVDFFLDGRVEQIGEIFCGRKIQNIEDISKDSKILICANPIYGIHDRLIDYDINNWIYVDPELIRMYSFDRKYFENQKKIMKENAEKIQKVYAMLADDISKEVFSAVLTHRFSHNIDALSKLYEKNQYFENDVIGLASGTIVDCGAYTGDTLKRFIAQGPNLLDENSFYYAFEASKTNYTLLNEYCVSNNLQRVKIFNLAVWDKEETLFFEHNSDRGKVGTGYETVFANSIDNILENQKIDMIVMDIEGAEINALNGAIGCITKNCPKLAISAYHELDHLWEIPLLIREINSNYQIYFRQHGWNIDDTVCYAIPHKV